MAKGLKLGSLFKLVKISGKLRHPSGHQMVASSPFRTPFCTGLPESLTLLQISPAGENDLEFFISWDNASMRVK
jgi:hypothetical protein